MTYMVHLGFSIPLYFKSSSYTLLTQLYLHIQTHKPLICWYLHITLQIHSICQLLLFVVLRYKMGHVPSSQNLYVLTFLSGLKVSELGGELYLTGFFVLDVCKKCVLEDKKQVWVLTGHNTHYMIPDSPKLTGKLKGII